MKGPDRDTYLPKGHVRLPDNARGRVQSIMQSNAPVDFLSIFFLSAGLFAAARTLTVFEGGLWRTLGMVALSVAALFLLTLRWWILPAGLAVTLSGCLIYYTATKNLSQWLHWWAGLPGWAIAGAVEDELYTPAGGILLLEVSMVFLLASIVFLLVRKLFSFLLILGGVTTALIVIYVVGREDMSAAVVLVSAGLCMLLPRVYARFVSRSSGSPQARAPLQIAAAPVALLLVILLLGVVPEDTTAWKSRGLVNLVQDIGALLQGPFRSHPPGRSNFSLSALGFQPEQTRLGGPVHLGDKTMLTVKTDRPVLLRGAVRDYYTGDSWWIGAPDGDFRYHSLIWRRYRREAFGAGQPSGREASKLYQTLTTKLTLDIRYETPRYSALFAPGKPTDIDFTDRDPGEDIRFNMRRELYLGVRMLTGTRIEVDAEVWNRDNDGFDTGFLELERLALEREDEQYTQLAPRHTQLPDTLPVSVRRLAEEITAGAASPYAKARAIEDWLAENSNYTLLAHAPTEGEDFVSRFLETGEGYCTYYASAMAVLGRCVGLPTRYVSGFALEQADYEAGLYKATEKTAHAWAEVYFHGIGWVEFDPLRWDAGAPLNADAESAPEPEQEPLPEPYREESDSAHEPVQEDNTPSGRSDPDSVPRFLLSLLAAAGALILLRWLSRYIMDSKFRAYSLNRMARRYPDRAQRMDAYYRDILRQLGWMGMEPRPGETLERFGVRVDRHIRIEDITFAEIALARTRYYFADIPPEQQDIATLHRYHNAMEKRLLDRFGKGPYFLRRILRP